MFAADCHIHTYVYMYTQTQTQTQTDSVRVPVYLQNKVNKGGTFQNLCRRELICDGQVLDGHVRLLVQVLAEVLRSQCPGTCVVESH
jgi:hypothetical protein